MRPQSTFILTLIALILSIVTAIIWFFIGTFFLSAFIAGITSAITEVDVDPSMSNVMPAFIVTLIQNILTLVIVIVCFVRTLPSRKVDTLKKDGIICLISGLVLSIISPIQVIPGLLIMIAGALLLKEANRGLYKVTIEKKDT